MNKVLFFARDPGGANSLVDIIKQSQLIYNCDVYAKDFACNIFANNNIEYKNILDIEDLLIVLDSYDLIFTGTSHLDDYEHKIWEKSIELKSNCIAYLDHWMGYERFYNSDKGEYSLPKTLIVTDAIAKEKILDKFKNYDIEVVSLGSTFLQKLYDTKLTSKQIIKAKTDKNLVKYDEIIVFAAEVIKGEQIEKKYGFNEYVQFKKLHDNLKYTNKKIKLFFLPHPKHHLREVESELKEILKYDNNIAFEISHKDNLVQLADKVFGINTMVLVEAMIYQVPSCSIQIGIKEISDFELLKRDIIYNANTNERLISFLNNDVKLYHYDTNHIVNSLDNIMGLIKSKIKNENF